MDVIFWYFVIFFVIRVNQKLGNETEEIPEMKPIADEIPTMEDLEKNEISEPKVIV